LYTDDAVLTVPGARFKGRDQVREYWRALYQGFPDGTVELGRYVESGDLFFAERVSRATNTGELSLPDGTTIPPTGKPIALHALYFSQVRDGKVAESVIYYDALSQMAQLGLAPSS
jgi:ketosteroid isomerase-like protein